MWILWKFFLAPDFHKPLQKCPRSSLFDLDVDFLPGTDDRLTNTGTAVLNNGIMVLFARKNQLYKHPIRFHKFNHVSYIIFSKASTQFTTYTSHFAYNTSCLALFADTT